jgi:hypothetical protein
MPAVVERDWTLEFLKEKGAVSAYLDTVDIRTSLWVHSFPAHQGSAPLWTAEI